MNPVEIEQAISALAEEPFDPEEFPFAFLGAFNKPTTIKRLRSGVSNQSDLGGVLQRNWIHIKVCPTGQAVATLAALRDSPATARAKAKFVLATDGEEFHAEELGSGDVVVCAYSGFPEHFGFFLPLAGISTVRQIRESAFDIKATGRLNRLYVELLKRNPEWSAADRRHEMNHFMARLIFCFFAEDTGIFRGDGLFTTTVDQMSAGDSANTHEVIGEIFRAMNTPCESRTTAGVHRWAEPFPYVNGGLFSEAAEVPRFSRVARSYLLHIGNLDWTKINPDIFGSMIQAVAEDEERGALGMHYTSVPNILKVLNPLFLDDLRAKLEEANNNSRKLLNLRNRMARIRVFDPACGSGNFLVIAYKELRGIEAVINERRGERQRRSDIRLTNFRGIELRDFPAEIARLALIIAEYQCDVSFRGQQDALAEFLPLDAENWITCGNALRLDWLTVCPPTGADERSNADDLLESMRDPPGIDAENAGGETYICSNPPYRGSTWQLPEQKEDLKRIFDGRAEGWKSLDYVAGWLMRAAEYGKQTRAVSAFVATNSICQGQQVAALWPPIFATGHEIAFAHTSFKWANLAAHNAGVSVVVVGISTNPRQPRRLLSQEGNGNTICREVASINAYLVPGANLIVARMSRPANGVVEMNRGDIPNDDGNLLLTRDEVDALGLGTGEKARFVRRFFGSREFIQGLLRYCLWIGEDDYCAASQFPQIRARFDAVQAHRSASTKPATRELSALPYRFDYMVRKTGEETAIVVPRVSSENRSWLPCGLLPAGTIVGDRNFALYDAPLWNMALIASRLHRVWVSAVCGRLETRFSYSNTLGWNTFPVPLLTTKNRSDLTECAENILLAREVHFPATIADLYHPEKMPPNLRAAHEHNDEVLERIFVGRRFRNDTERLEELFRMYAEMTAAAGQSGRKATAQ